MIQVVEDYLDYTAEIPRLISETYYKSEFFIKALELKPATYYRKLKENRFDKEEVKKLTKILFPKEAYLEELKADLQQSREDIEKGRVTEHSEVMGAIRKDYL